MLWITLQLHYFNMTITKGKFQSDKVEVKSESALPPKVVHKNKEFDFGFTVLSMEKAKM